MRKKRRKRRDPISISLLKEKADKIFSIFIRLRDKCICFTCARKKPFEKTQAGHFITRTCEELRFNEKNVHCQCEYCNIWKGGEKIVYTLKMLKKYGQKLVNEFERIKFRSHKHWKPAELKKIIEKYKLKVEKMK